MSKKKKYSAVEGGLSYFSAVLAYIIISVVMSIVLATTGKGGTGYTVTVFIGGLLIQIAILVSAVMPSKVLGTEMTYSVKPVSAKTVLLSILLAIICIVSFDGIALVFSGLLLRAGYVPGSSFDFSTAGGIVMATIQAVIFAPFCEEFLMRGSVLSSLGYTGIMKERLRVFFMVTVSGFLFAFLHMNPMQTVYQFFFGCALAYVTISFKNILPAIIMHLFNNAVGVVLSLPAVDAPFTSFILGVVGGWGIIIMIIISILLLVGGGLLVRYLCKRVGGERPSSPVRQTVTVERAEDFHNFADDGGSMVGGMLYTVSVIVCMVVWAFTLAGGFAGA